MFLTDAEIDAMCEGVKRNADKRRRLRAMGLIVNEKPNGRALVGVVVLSMEFDTVGARNPMHDNDLRVLTSARKPSGVSL